MSHNTPERVQLPTDAEAHSDWLSRAVETLAEGHLVVIPTETVYGVAARADQEDALARLAQAKGTTGDRPWTWHVGSAATLERFPAPGALARRLVQRYWPGPLTLVLPGVPEGLERVARSGWTGVRCTAGMFSAALCEAAPFPLVMSSANAQGQAPTVDAVDLGDLQLDEHDLILEGRGSSLQESSSVLKLGEGSFELLREGLHGLDSLRRAAGMRLAFACTGNTCRSPMAEGIARQRIAQRLQCEPARLNEFGFEVLSMGIFAGPGSPAAQHAVDTLRPQGIDLTQHASRQATPELVADIDAVYCLTSGHLAALQQILPPSKGDRLHLLDPDGGDIADPIGGNAEVYAACAAQIADCIERRLNDWA